MRQLVDSALSRSFTSKNLGPHSAANRSALWKRWMCEKRPSSMVARIYLHRFLSSSGYVEGRRQ